MENKPWASWQLKFLSKLNWYWFNLVGKRCTGLILGLHPANERRRYKVTPSLIRRAQTQNEPWMSIAWLSIFERKAHPWTRLNHTFFYMLNDVSTCNGKISWQACYSCVTVKTHFTVSSNDKPKGLVSIYLPCLYLNWYLPWVSISLYHLTSTEILIIKIRHPDCHLILIRRILHLERIDPGIRFS